MPRTRSFIIRNGNKAKSYEKQISSKKKLSRHVIQQKQRLLLIQSANTRSL